MNKKKIDLGEYVIHIVYDDSNGNLDVSILDELGDLVEAIIIRTDDDENDSTPTNVDFNLN